MKTVPDARILATLDYAPTENGEEFDKFCEKWDFHPLASGRRAWCHQYATYFRGALGVATVTDGTFLFYEEDLAND